MQTQGSAGTGDVTARLPSLRAITLIFFPVRYLVKIEAFIINTAVVGPFRLQLQNDIKT